MAALKRWWPLLAVVGVPAVVSTIYVVIYKSAGLRYDDNYEIVRSLTAFSGSYFLLLLPIPKALRIITAVLYWIALFSARSPLGPKACLLSGLSGPGKFQISSRSSWLVGSSAIVGGDLGVYGDWPLTSLHVRGERAPLEETPRNEFRAH